MLPQKKKKFTIYYNFRALIISLKNNIFILNKLTLYLILSD